MFISCSGSSGSSFLVEDPAWRFLVCFQNFTFSGSHWRTWLEVTTKPFLDERGLSSLLNVEILQTSCSSKFTSLIYLFSLFVFFLSPYIIGTMNQATSSTPNLQLHHNFRYCLFIFLVYVCGLAKEQWLVSHLRLFLAAEIAN